MKYCPKCRDEFEDALAQCPGCAVDLVVFLQEDQGKSIDYFDNPMRNVPDFQGLKMVFSGSLALCSLVRSWLQTEGIDSWIDGEDSAVNFGGLAIGEPSLQSVDLMVRENDYEKAKEAIARASETTEAELNQAVAEAESDSLED